MADREAVFDDIFALPDSLYRHLVSCRDVFQNPDFMAAAGDVFTFLERLQCYRDIVVRMDEDIFHGFVSALLVQHLFDRRPHSRLPDGFQVQCQ